MFDSEIFEEKIAQDSDLIKRIIELSEAIIIKNQCQFKIEELEIETALLITAGVLKKEGDFLQIKENGLLSYITLKSFLKRFDYTINNSLSDLFAFLDGVNKYFIDPEKSRHGKTAFTDSISAMAFKIQHQFFHPPFNNFTKSFKAEPKNVVYPFAKALSMIFADIEYTPLILLKLLKQLYPALRFDEPNVGNFPVIELQGGLRRYSFLHPLKAKKLLTLLQMEKSALNEMLMVPVINGLLENDINFLKNLAPLSSEESNHIPIICSLSNISNFSEEHADIALTIVKSISNNSKRYTQQLSYFFSGVLENKNIRKKKIFTYALNQLKILITNIDIDVASSAIYSLSNLKDREKQVSDLLIYLISKPQFDQKLLNGISHVLYEYNDCSFWFDFLYAMADKLPFKSNHSFLKNIQIPIRDKNLNTFDKHLIDMLIHDEGKIRWMAKQIFSFMGFSSNIRNFSFDINELSSVDQFKLLTSILSDYHEPKYNMPFLLPLFNSKSDIVKEAMIFHSELLNIDYGGSVSDLLKEEWKTMTEEQVLIYNRIESSMISFSIKIKEKSKIKELNPLYTQSSYLHLFSSQYGREYSKNLEAGIDKNSIFRHLAKTVKLAKGGGWKNPDNNEVTQLSSFSTSMVLPRSLFISTDNFEWEHQIEMQENWTKYENIWAAII